MFSRTKENNVGFFWKQVHILIIQEYIIKLQNCKYKLIKKVNFLLKIFAYTDWSFEKIPQGVLFLKFPTPDMV
jgi:hypothetical protein